MMHRSRPTSGLCPLVKSIAVCLSIIPLTSTLLSSDAQAQLPELRVSANHRFLETGDGKPFFWLGDTAWELFHRSSREDAIKYLDHRAANGYTVIQSVALAELDGLHAPNAYGHVPLEKDDPTLPLAKDGPNNDYWDHVDFVVAEANKRGIYVAFLPTWGDKWNKKWGNGPEIFNVSNAESYGEWIGKRYRDAGVIWVLGGDRPVESDLHRDILRAMAKGLKRGDSGKHLMTFHPVGGSTSSDKFHNEEWLDFNMRQNGHDAAFNDSYAGTLRDYRLTPIKPVLDAEPIYEDHPVAFDQKKNGHSIASDVRRPLYWDLLSGACGHTYGHHSVWQFFSKDRTPINDPLMTWDEAILQPGAAQMKHGKNLLLSRNFPKRTPDDSIIVPDRVETAVPGRGRYHLVGARWEDGSCAMVYVPIGRPFLVKMDCIAGKQVIAWWFDPRSGQATKIGSYANTGVQNFVPPNPGEMLDWVLVLDDAAKHKSPPGTKE